MTIDTPPLAHALISARRNAELLPFAPDMAPASLAKAMAVQKVVSDAIDRSIAGWKVGYAPDGAPVAAPLYASLMHRGGGRLRVGPSGKSGVEVEIALVLGRDLPPRPGKPYDREDILEAADTLLLGVEIVESRFADPPKPPFLVSLADNIGNGAYIRGPDVTDFRRLDLVKLRSSLWIDGRLVHEGVGGHSKGDPLIPVIDYANHPSDLLGGLKAGQVVTTGTLNGCPFVEGACRVKAEIEGLGKVEFEIGG